MMRDLAISYGNSRQAKNWVNKTISFDALKERLKTTIRTTESAEEYAKMSKAQRDAAKDHGGFVGGTLKGGRRKIDTVELRSMIALDGDRIDNRMGFLSKHPTTGKPIPSPFINIGINYMNQAVRLWNEIFQIVKENCSTEYGESTPQDDLMERLLRARKG